VAIGKLTVWGLAAGGEEALLRTLELLKTEIATTMANIGTKRVTDLGPRSLRPSPPPDPASWPVGSSLPASVARVKEPSDTKIVVSKTES
jgi:hypothetical protein